MQVIYSVKRVCTRKIWGFILLRGSGDNRNSRFPFIDRPFVVKTFHKAIYFMVTDNIYEVKFETRQQTDSTGSAIDFK